jgi:hypothetical protein
VAASLLSGRLLVRHPRKTPAHRSRIPRLWLVLVAVLCCALTGRLSAAQSVTLAWDANSELDLAGYRLYCGTIPRGYDHSIDVTNATTTAVADLQAGTTYFFAVVAYNTAGLESDFSNEVAYTTTNSPSVGSTPTIIEVTQPESYVVVTWTSNPGQSYRVVYKDRLDEIQWMAASEVLVAIGPQTSWTDLQANVAAQRFYAILPIGP